MAGENLVWFKKWDKVLDYDFEKPIINWFKGGKLNVTYNCLDRYVKTPSYRNKAALIWEADDKSYKTFTYQQLYRRVNRFANVLKKKGVKKGDRVSIYLPMIPELAISMLACARIGAIHSIARGFSASALKDRIQDCESSWLITADGGMRGGRHVPLKAAADEALNECPTIKKSVIVVSRLGNDGTDMEPGRDSWWHEEMCCQEVTGYCPPEWTTWQTRFSSSIPQAPPENRRACCIPPAAICSTRT